jgi:hypothetical protein
MVGDVIHMGGKEKRPLGMMTLKQILENRMWRCEQN